LVSIGIPRARFSDQMREDIHKRVGKEWICDAKGVTAGGQRRMEEAFS
jgi:hypothetical protein